MSHVLYGLRHSAIPKYLKNRKLLLDDEHVVHT